MLKSIIDKIQASLDTHSKGYSARKLSALAIMLCVIAAHIAWLKKAFMENDFNLLSEILMIDYAFIASLLGMTTYQNLKSAPKDEPAKVS